MKTTDHEPLTLPNLTPPTPSVTLFITDMSTAIETETNTTVSLTESAAVEIKSKLTEAENAGKTLRIYVEKGGCSGMQYGMVFDEPRAGDFASDQNGVTVLVDEISSQDLRGTVVEFSGTVGNSGNITLTNVLVFTSQTGKPTLLLAPFSLAPGASVPFAGSYVAVGGYPMMTNFMILTNLTEMITTNISVVITTNTTTTITTNATVARELGTIDSVAQTVVDRFPIGTTFTGLTYAGEDHGYGATDLYAMRQDTNGLSHFDTITASTASTADRFVTDNRTFDGLTYAAGDLGYGPLLFYYLTHDATGLSTFGSITPGGVVGVTTDHFVVGYNFDALTFTATDLGYGANLFYYVRHDANGLSTFGTINPALPGTVTDRFTVGTNIIALVFTPLAAPGYGPNNFYYLRRGPNSTTTFGTIFVTGLSTAAVTDRFSVGTNATALTFTATDLSFGANLFYFIRTGGVATQTNTVTTFGTNTTTLFATNSVLTYMTNASVTFTTTNTVMAVGMDLCQGRTVSAAANCLGPVTPPLAQTPAPLISLPQMVAGSFRLTFPTVSGQSYTLQFKDSLANPVWLDGQTFMGTGGSITATNATGMPQPAGFYRIRISP